MFLRLRPLYFPASRGPPASAVHVIPYTVVPVGLPSPCPIGSLYSLLQLDAADEASGGGRHLWIIGHSGLKHQRDGAAAIVHELAIFAAHVSAVLVAGAGDYPIFGVSYGTYNAASNVNGKVMATTDSFVRVNWKDRAAVLVMSLAVSIVPRADVSFTSVSFTVAGVLIWPSLPSDTSTARK